MPQTTAIYGETSRLLDMFIQDTRRVDGRGLGGLLYNTSGLKIAYNLQTSGAWVPVTLVTMTFNSWASGGFIEEDATNALGWYQFGLPNAALAQNVKSVKVHIAGAANMTPIPILIELAPGIAAAVVVRG